MIRKSAGIVIKDKSVLYLRKRGFLFYILPGGKIEENETARDTLVRELMEELSSKIKILGKVGSITCKGYNKNLETVEEIKLILYRVRLLDKIRLSGEIFEKEFIKHKNMHRFLLTPPGIHTIELLYKKRLID